jgi:hypothetical protein
MLSKSRASRYSCFIPHFKGNRFSFSPVSMMLFIGLSYIAFIMLRYIPSPYWRAAYRMWENLASHTIDK